MRVDMAREARTESGLTLRLTTRGDGAVFDRFFAGYDRAFVLPDEKEDEAGFRTCLDLNHGEAHAALVARYGPFCEICLIAEETESGAFVGGANLIAMPVAGRITANLNYIYVDGAARGRGCLARMVAAIGEVVGGLFPDEAAGAPLIFIEQNDPFAMSPENYAHDSAATGLDQIDRLRIWARRGALAIDFPYVQPPLSAAQQPDAALLLSVLGSTGPILDACLLEGHLRRFFGISVLKGRAAEAEPSAAAQLAALAAACGASEGIALRDPAPLLAALLGPADLDGLFHARPTSFRAALQQFATPSIG